MSEFMDSCRLVSSEIDSDCGCTEEEWDTPVGAAFTHVKPDGTGDVFFDNGEAEWEIEITGDNKADFRRKLTDYIHSLPYLDI